MTAFREGKVIRVRPGQVELSSGEERIRAFLRGQLKSGPRAETHVVAVGDEVRWGCDAAGVATLEEILPRRNAISRVDPGSTKRPIRQVIAANLDWLVVVVSLARPALNLRGLDRLLVLGEVSRVPVLIVFNKIDAASTAAPDPGEIYRSIGYAVLRTSALTGEGMDDLERRLRGNVSLLVGPSGVGKSTMLNRLVPAANLASAAISSATKKGVHTTTRVEWIPLPHGGAVLDSPGIRSIVPWGLDRDALRECFPEFRTMEPCRFRDCRHAGETGCAAPGAIARGDMTADRYESYSRILQSLVRPGADKKGSGPVP